MAKFSSDNQPEQRRGRDRRKLIVEALERAGLDEEAFYDKVIEIAVTNADTGMMRELLIRFNPIPKPVAPQIKFSFPDGGTPVEKIDAIIRGVADGEIPTDLGKQITDMIKTGLDVLEVTELAVRLENLERLLERRDKE
ncbi:coil containing protein [Yersinia phage vB_YenS_P400]|nr:coil containing protein [Yersinia phage vB_YenS_P400]